MLINGVTYKTVAYYTQGTFFRCNNQTVMGLPPQVRWFDLFGVSEEGNNIAIVYIGCNPPPNTNQVIILWEEDFNSPINSGSFQTHRIHVQRLST